MDIDLQEGWNRLERWMKSDRIGRRHYVETNVFAGVAGFAIILFPFFILLLLPDFNSDFLMVPIASVGIATAIVMILVYIATSIARLRDMGRSTNWFIAGLVPYLNVLFFIVLAMTQGKLAKKRITLSGRKKKDDAPSA
jgi:uncharacterized membrane protein YhaH (DUF805 family)